MKTTKHFQQLGTFLLDIILPKHCLSCNKEGIFFCIDCLDKIKPLSWQVCPICQKFLTEYGEICNNCKPFKPEIDSLTIATEYSNPAVSKSIHLLKYKFVNELSDPLAKILTKAYQKNKLAIPDYIVPVPLHPLRLRWRGFNQANLLAQNLAKNLLPGYKIKVKNHILNRIKFTSTQAKLKKTEERQKNIEEAFFIDPKFSKQIKNKRILLVDDVCTTGSTLVECAKQLRKFKPKAIHGIVIGRQG